MGDTSLAPSPSTTTTTNPENEFWIFGYGSLIWKPPPHFDRRIPGYVTGYIRRFWQRRPPRHPLLPRPRRNPNLPLPLAHPPRSAFSPPLLLLILSILPPKDLGRRPYNTLTPTSPKYANISDIREINGYTIHYTEFYPAASSSSSSFTETQQQQQQQPIQTLLYIGTPSNPQFTGPQDPQELAEHIFRSEGPSGLNRDYLLSLDVACMLL
ncbi:uncharacterized protein EAF02_004146 [Botrytis sinoallii]|uniref:uncharacterized protein n=1 Tax=Botrytis sinoallii TaxID=1463999 RepID=UPI001901707A|nr:uncharacterized protein EAF02_004146 [Botrytis sinoallii]KAF7885637.1 hypothetical protein EAF02_004146 [Botrytis sinoallii]